MNTAFLDSMNLPLSVKEVCIGSLIIQVVVITGYNL